MNRLLLAATTSLMTLALATTANAVPLQLTAFGQTSGSNTVTATANGGLTATTLSITNAQINISQILGLATPIAADFSLTAASTGAAVPVLGLAVQRFSGSFCLTSAAGCGGINFLSGTFTDAAVGALGGVGLVVNVASPPDTLNLTSSVIAAANLGSPNTVNFSFSNVNPAVGICGTTLCSFTASFAGTVSANATKVPEPASLAVMGIGLLGFSFFARRKSSSSKA